MKTKNTVLKLRTRTELDFADITDRIIKFVRESKIKDGLVNIQSLHTTAMLVLNENEPLLIKDMKKHLARLSSKSQAYDHDNFEVRTVNVCPGECANGHSHCKALHLLANITLNLIDGMMRIGLWQRVFLVELDRSREREVQVQIIGA